MEQAVPSQDVVPTKEEIPSTIPTQEGVAYKELGTDVSSVLVPQEASESMPIAEPEPMAVAGSGSGSGTGSGSVADSGLALDSVPMAVQESAPVPAPAPAPAPVPTPEPMTQPAQEQKPEKEIVNDVDTSLAILEARCKRFGIPFDPEKHRPKAQTVQAPQRQQNNVCGDMALML